MAHFAKIENNIVTQVIVAEQDFIDSGVLEGQWVQTSYNTGGGEYKLGKDKAEKDVNKLLGTEKDKKARDRKNYAGVGYTYDPVDDMFIPPQPYPSWKLVKETGTWEAPKKMPVDDNLYKWDEDLLDWIIQK